MRYEILKGSDGRRWGRMVGSGAVAELRAGDPPPKKKPARK